MQKTYEGTLNKFVAVILIMVLTLADLITVGLNFASFAIDMVATSSNNVEFEAYFKDKDGEKVTVTEEALNTENLKMYVEVSVLREGYFNGKISLENSNLKIKNVTENSYVNSIENNTINLNQINSGKTVTLELQVTANTSATMNEDILNKDTIVKIDGSYVHSKGTDNVQGTTVITAKFVSPNDITSTVGAKILTNKIYSVEGTNKRILQTVVTSKIQENVYPTKNTKINIKIPTEAESVEVTSRTTAATNKNITFGQENYTYDQQTSNVQITLENNKDQNGNISFEQNSKDEFVITCIYAEDKKFSNENKTNEQTQEENIKENQIKVSQEITTYDNKTLKADKQFEINNEVDGIINYEISQQENEFYKGKLYSGEERTYNINVRSYINTIKTEKNISFTLENTDYLAGETKKSSKITYKEITIKKDDFTKVLGEEGYITVKDEKGTVFANITKETEADENGNIIVKLPQDTYKVYVQTSNAKSIGKIDFKAAKTILEKDYTHEEIKTFTGIENRITANSEVISNRITLKETTTKAKLEIGTNTLKAGKNENVQMKVTLLANDESKDLYKNPTIKITFPKNAKEVTAKYKMLYGNGLEKNTAIVKEENGRKVLEITLTGEQEIYQGQVIDGTDIIVNANITMDRFMTSGEDSISLEYTNEKANNYAIENKQISEKKTAKASDLTLREITRVADTNDIIADTDVDPSSGIVIIPINTIQQDKMIVINDIEELDVETTGKEEDKIVELKATGETQNATVKIGATNNEGETLNNVKILGNFPTKSSTNTMDINLTSNITITSATQNAHIYYSAKEDATDDLTDAANGWTEDNSIENKRSYLIVIPEFANAESFNAEYGISISKSADEEKVASERFKVSYRKENETSDSIVESTKVVFNIGGNKDLEMTLTATVGGETLNDGDEVHQGEVIEYTVSLTNKGKKDTENVTITGLVPEGTKLYKTRDAYEEENESNEQVKIFEKINVKVGEKISLSYSVKIDNNCSEGKNIENFIKTDSDIKSNTLTNVVRKSDIVLEYMTSERKNTESIKSGYIQRYILKVTNNTNQTIGNINIALKNNDRVEILKDIETNISDENKFTIQEIKANESYYEIVYVYVKEATNDSKCINLNAISTFNNNDYKSNIIEEKIAIYQVRATVNHIYNGINSTINSGEIFNYEITVENIGEYDVEQLIIKDVIFEELEIELVKIGNKEVVPLQYKENKEKYIIMEISDSLKVGEIKKIEIQVKVKNNSIEQQLQIINKSKIYNSMLYICETNEDVSPIKLIPSNKEENNETYKEENISIYENKHQEENNETREREQDKEEQDNKNNDIKNYDNQENKESYIKEKEFKISGQVWVDKEDNAKKSKNSVKIQGVKVYLVEESTGNDTKNLENQILETQTNEKGEYVLENIKKGKYIVLFEYDSNKYVPTEYQKQGIDMENNSDAIDKSMVINGETKKFASTDIIEVNSDIYNIDLGLVEIKKFDLELSKIINKVKVETKNITREYDFNGTTLAKVEIEPKELNNSKVQIEYIIRIKNNGDLPGYARSISDYLPEDLIMDSNINSDWNYNNNYIYNNSLEKEIINPGEYKEIKLILTKTMTENNTGLISNTAEISEDFNDYGIKDIDSTVANRKQEDDLGQADIIIGVKTGIINEVTAIVSLTILVSEFIFLAIKRK